MDNQPNLPTETLLHTRRFDVQRIHWISEDKQIHPRDVVRHPGSVAILPMVDDGHVCLIRNFRAAVDKTLFELPAGTRDQPGEEPIATAHRELIEETGYRAEKMEPLHAFFLSPGVLDERMFLFVATQLTAGKPAREPGEQIENSLVPWNEALRMVVDGDIEDAKTILGLLLYDQVRRR